MITVALRARPGRERYEGPLDLLLALVRRGGYPMDALPVAEITRQYNLRLREAGGEAADIELGGAYLEVASWLVLLQSRALLPPAPGEDGEVELPGQELARALLDHAQVQKTAALLGERLAASGFVAGAAPGAHGDVVPAEPEFSPEPAPPTVTVMDALTAARRAFAVAQAHAQAADAVPDDPYPIGQILTMLDTRLRDFAPGCGVSTEPWFQELPDIEARAALLLALLELTRSGRILVHQHEDFGQILLKPVLERGANQAERLEISVPQAHRRSLSSISVKQFLPN